MEIKLKSLFIENFKGIKQLYLLFDEKTLIKGQNASGKTTIFDSFTCLLYNKNSAGDEKFNIRPLDENGNRIDNVEIKIVGLLTVDGKEVELSKVQKQKWVKKRGSESTELQGNINVFEIDGYPKSESDYKAYVSGLVQEDLFKILTNPQYFPNLKWKEQRDILMKIVSDVSDVDIAKGNPEFVSLVPELEKAPSTDDIQKKYSKALSEYKKKQAEIPVRIDELSKSITEIDVAEKELQKSDLERQIEDINSKILNSDDELSALRSEEMNLQFELSGISQRLGQELYKKKNELQLLLMNSGSSLIEIGSRISFLQNKISDNKGNIEKAETKRTELREEYNETSQRTFDEKPYEFKEDEWNFDETSTVCKMCGQKLPEEKIQSLISDFESRKENAKKELKEKLESERGRFLIRRTEELERIKKLGFEQKDIISNLSKENEEFNKELSELNEKYKSEETKKTDLKNKILELPNSADLSKSEEYILIKKKHEGVKAKIADLESKTDTEKVQELENKKSLFIAQLEEVKAEIAMAAKNIEIEERIAELEEEQKSVSQKVADQEKMLYVLEQFIKTKMLMISETINSKFNTVSWKLFEEQINGGMRECCECTVNGVPYSTLNSGHRIVAGLDIITSLSQLYGVSAPIFIDNAESLNDYNIPKMDAQMVLLYVSDDNKLVVESEG